MNTRAFVVLAVLFVLVPPHVASAGVQHRIEGSVFQALNAPRADGARLRIERVPLLTSKVETLLVEPFDVLAPSGVIEVFDANGKGEIVHPQPMRQFRGVVEGDPSSVVYFSIVKGAVDGIIISRDHKFTLRAAPQDRSGRAATPDVYVEEISAMEDYSIGEGFTCGVEGKNVIPAARTAGRRLETNAIQSNAYSWPTSTATTMINLAVESDSALYARFSNDASAVETFLRNLVAASAAIYVRDLRTDIRIAYLGIRTTTDPWSVNPATSGTWDGASVTWTTTHALLEYGDYWRTAPPQSVKKSAAILVSGQDARSGLAWTDFLCGQTQEITADWEMGAPYTNHTFGSFAYCGGVGMNPDERTVPTPTTGTNYAAPSNYWPLMEFTHELGHVVQSLHTHCVGLSDADKLTYGRNFVDNCHSGENANGTPCYSGATTLPSDALDGKGTIMSYCHMLAGAAGVRFAFGRTGEASHQILDNMRAKLDDLTPAGFSAITAPSSVAPGGSGAASVNNTAGLTYDWSITNGTFSGGATTATGASVTFTGATNPVTLRVTATNASGCAVSDSKQVYVGTSLNAPVQVAATAVTATSVYISWNPEAGVAGYNVYRRTGATWALVGSPTNNDYTDTSATANSSYLYKVRTRDANGNESADSDVDLATTVMFTDNLGVGSTPVKAVHLTELRTAANSLRALRGLGTATFTDPGLARGTVIKAVHLTQLGDDINASRTALGFARYEFSHTPEYGTLIRQQHVYVLREAVR